MSSQKQLDQKNFPTTTVNLLIQKTVLYFKVKKNLIVNSL